MKGILLVAVLVALTPVAALGQGICNNRGEVLKHLSKKYKETPIAAGVTNTGGLIEVLSEGEEGTWTIIITTPQGVSCLVAAGEGWRTLRSELVEGEGT